MNQKQKHGMVMRYPATRWQDALPTGSGVVGALVYGNIQNDTILLNHDALFYPRGGSVKGICCRGGITLNMGWDRSGAAFNAELFSKFDQRVVLRLPDWVESVKFEPKAVAMPSAAYGNGYWDVDLRKGVPLRIISK